jgi:uncharacterized cupin superfamily protein
MAKVFQVDPTTFEPRASPLPDFAWHSSPRFGQLAGSGRLQVDVRSLDPGRFSFPYHFHRASEELFHVVSGEATLRTLDGFQRLSAGDLAFFEQGPTGAHQLYNHGPVPFVYLDVRAQFGIDVAEYPDSGKIAILPLTGEVFESHSKVDYHKGEESVRSHWPPDVLGPA